MEVKKSIKADLDHKRELFFSVGLLISMLFIIAAFEWKSLDPYDLVNFDSFNLSNFDETIEIPPTNQPPPPPPVFQQVTIIEVPDDEEIIRQVEINFDIEITEDEKIEQVTYEPPAIEEEEVEEIFTFVEFQPVPVGGYEQFYKQLGERIKYPKEAKRLGIEGKVFVQFVVDQSGALTDVTIIKGIGSGCDEEAIRVIENMPKWQAGKQRGKAVKVKMVIPITFHLM